MTDTSVPQRNITGIRFQRAGKIHYYDHGDMELEVNDHVVIEVKHGLKIARVVIAPHQVIASEVSDSLPGIVRKAATEDLDRWSEAKEKGAGILAKCKELVAKHNMPVKIIETECNLAGDRFTVYFSASEKIDTRQLARQLSASIRTKVDIRQVGPRDATKLVGGIGRCGALFCCTTFLTEFNPVSIKMAKEQSLSLDPMKNSGCCGRLMCCLEYEVKYYQAMNKKLPRQGHRINTPLGEGKVIGTNALKETVMVQLENGTVAEISHDDLAGES